MTEEIKKIINEAKNICLIPSQKEPESIIAALALFYTLKDLGKNVNVVTDSIPEKLQFLIPSLETISQPQSFVISVPKSVADISQVYYEKNEEQLKIHLTVTKGQLKKENISLYAENTKPDLVLALGITDIQQELTARLDEHGYLLGAPINNLDTNPIWLLELIASLGNGHPNKNAANCLLTALTLHYDNFKNPATSSQTFETAAKLIKQGAEYHSILANI